MNSLLFHPDVRIDVTESFSFYENKLNGLGQDFVVELEQAYQAIVDFPTTWPYFGNGFRRYVLARFPFAVIYKETDERIFVVAIMHQSRKPNYWVKRL